MRVSTVRVGDVDQVLVVGAVDESVVQRRRDRRGRAVEQHREVHVVEALGHGRSSRRRVRSLAMPSDALRRAAVSLVPIGRAISGYGSSPRWR